MTGGGWEGRITGEEVLSVFCPHSSLNHEQQRLGCDFGGGTGAGDAAGDVTTSSKNHD